jgi:hypothetical protein
VICNTYCFFIAMAVTWTRYMFEVSLMCVWFCGEWRYMFVCLNVYSIGLRINLVLLSLDSGRPPWGRQIFCYGHPPPPPPPTRSQSWTRQKTSDCDVFATICWVWYAIRAVWAERCVGRSHLTSFWGHWYTSGLIFAGFTFFLVNVYLGRKESLCRPPYIQTRAV